MNLAGNKWLRKLVLTGLLSILGGCGLMGIGKSPQEPVHEYMISAGFGPGAGRTVDGSAESCISAQVLLPRAAPGFSTSRMAYTREQDQIDYFAYNQWVDTPAYMIQPMLIRALQESGRFGHVVRAPALVGRRFRLESDDLALVQDFRDGVNSVRLTLRVRLIDTQQRTFLFDEVFDLEQKATSADPRAGVIAANQLARKLVDGIAEIARERVDGTAFCGDPDDDF